MEKVDAAALDGAMWWPNAGRVIKVPEVGEAAVLFACWLEDSEEAAGLDAIGEPAEGRALLIIVARKRYFIEQVN